MKKILVFIVYIICLLPLNTGIYGQDETGVEIPDPESLLFRDKDPLPVQLRYSNKDIKRETNDSTYLESMIWFRQDGQWDSLPVNLRARGNFRRKTCYFAPLKLKIKKSKSEGTLFMGNEKLKMVLPCQLDRNTSDYILKEYLAYRLYECVAPYHFKTRLTEVSLFDQRRRREVDHRFYGFFIEDMDHLCDRYEGKEVGRLIHPLQQDDLASIQNAFFEYMIANTDYSTKQQHNQKLLFTNKRIIPVPYDFDMSGLVNAPYATVTNIQNLSGSITRVTDRIYKGYERDTALLQEVRAVYIDKRQEMIRELEELEPMFEDPLQYREAKDFLESFFEILKDDKKFEREILNRLRTR